ncbi:MAG: hypothetical protein Q9170_005366, partial [Blastenia crenularia]
MSQTWGPYLYQSDLDLCTLDLISTEAAAMFPDPNCLRCPLLPSYFTLRFPIDKPNTIRQLNAGIFHRLVRRLKYLKNDLAVILLAAVGMELGVQIAREDMLVVRMTVMKADMGAEKRGQMERAMEG